MHRELNLNYRETACGESTLLLLTTGLDAPTCRNVVLVRLVNSMGDFKQIIGRGTRVRDDHGTLWINILAYTGSAARNCSPSGSLTYVAHGWSELTGIGNGDCQRANAFFCDRRRPPGKPKPDM